MKINLNHNIDQIANGLQNVAKKQLPFATSLATNNTAKRVQQAERKEMRQKFRAVSRWTTGAVFIKPSNKKQQAITAKVWINDRGDSGGTTAEQRILPHIKGGDRPLKASERMLRRAGILEPDEYAIPSKHQKRDRYGNLPKSGITKVLAEIGARDDIGYTSNVNYCRRRRNRAQMQMDQLGIPQPEQSPLNNRKCKNRRKGTWRYFYQDGKHHDARGIYRERVRGSQRELEPVLAFVDRVHYNQRIDWYGVGRRTVDRHYNSEFKKAYRHAMKTARWE